MMQKAIAICEQDIAILASINISNLCTDVIEQMDEFCSHFADVKLVPARVKSLYKSMPSLQAWLYA